MNAERTGPVTFGQLSVLRSLESYGSVGQRVANLVSVWPVPAGASVGHVVDAWQQLVVAHESLRTGFSTERGRPVQTVHPAGVVSVPVLEVSEDAHAATRELAAEWAADPIDITAGQPWRAFAVVHRGAPLYLVAVIHHIAADNGALRVLREQFQRLVEGEVLGPQAQPLDLALAQQEDAHAARAVDHWAVRWGPFRPEDRQEGDTSTRRRATLYSVEGLQAARRIAQRSGASVQAIVLALGALALARVKERDQITFGLMTANRLDRQWSELVSSLNQCVPFTVDIDDESAPDSFLNTTYRASMDAYLHGCFDVDALRSELTARGRLETDPTYFSAHYNFLGAGDGEPPQDAPVRTGVAWRTSHQRIGPNFHLAVAIERGLFIGVGASVDYLPDELPAFLAASIEGGLMTLADSPPESLGKLSLEPRRDLGRQPRQS
ncbi:condensation domain-containing protein [Streptomyces sp. NRRL S-1022]|uniref:condensation domain-containing protein n=1 Tax=Streptomyces sp. NRRL S-1022 TaxID=1463880 RepID=UPI00099D6E08|nr:condensation domain-containing protein [Streptomyces sp. NRRL S-1022]